jgi:Ser-tRNA(Ala) deacylase AlaX
MSNELQNNTSIIDLHTYIASCSSHNANDVAITTYDSHLRSRFGGQLEDGGSIYLAGWHDISDVLLVNKRRMFVVKNVEPSLFLPDSPTVLRLDNFRRSRISNMHTAIHLLCALTEHQVIRGYAGTEVSKVEFAGDVQSFNSRFRDVYSRFRDCVASKLSVEVIYSTREEIFKFGKVAELNAPYVSENQVIRMVSIQGVDLRACNGTHAKNTGELALIEFTQAESSGKNKFVVRLRNSVGTPVW